MNKHTPTPWRLSKTTPKDYPDKISVDGADGSFVALVDSRGIPGMQDANAALIVHAVNSFDAMREALRPIAQESVREDLSCHNGLVGMEECARCSEILAARAALKLAEEG